MTTFVKLTDVRGKVPIWVNVDRVRVMQRQAAITPIPEHTMLWFDGSAGEVSDSHRRAVLETPEEIAGRADPENECPDPESCCYVSHYLAYGGPDLTHGGYHAAEKLADRHMSNCSLIERTGECRSCKSYEERLRA